MIPLQASIADMLPLNADMASTINRRVFPSLKRLSAGLELFQPLSAAPVFLSVTAGTPPMWAALLTAIAPWLIYFLMNRRFIRKTPFDVPIIVFICGMLIGFLVSTDKAVSSEALATTFASVSIYYGLINNAHRGRAYWAAMAGISGIIILLLSIWFFSQGEQRLLPFNSWAFKLAEPLPKISDQMLGLHSLGTLFAVTIPVVLAKSLFGSGRMRPFLLIAVFALAAILFLSTSGAGLGGAFFAVIFVLAIWKRRTLCFSLPVAGSVITLLAINYVKWGWPSRVFSTLALQHRIDTWTKTIALMKDFWFTGTGAGNWSAVFFDRYAERWINAHNSYLQLWADTGMIGILAASIAFLIFLRLSWSILKSQKTSGWRGIGIGLTGSIIAGGLISVFEVINTGAFETPEYHYLSIPLLWVIAALFVVSHYRLNGVPQRSL